MGEFFILSGRSDKLSDKCQDRKSRLPYQPLSHNSCTGVTSYGCVRMSKITFYISQNLSAGHMLLHSPVLIESSIDHFRTGCLTTSWATCLITYPKTEKSLLFWLIVCGDSRNILHPKQVPSVLKQRKKEKKINSRYSCSSNYLCLLMSQKKLL